MVEKIERATNCKFYYFIHGYTEAFSVEYEQQKKWAKIIIEELAEGEVDLAKNTEEAPAGTQKRRQTR